jgi:phosphoenolpyruvate-protein kinase (PTS system EI component)
MTQDDRNLIQPRRDPTTFTGVAISPGVGMGPAWLVVDLLKSAPDPAAIAPDQIAGEWNRILTSFEQTRRALEESALRIEEQFDAALAGIFRAHRMMLDSILSSGEIERELESLVGAEAAVLRVFRRLHERFMALEGPTLQQRADDVADLGRRVLRHLRGVDGSLLEHVPAGNVLVVERLLPSDVVPLSRRGVAAIVVGALASGAHAALLAREKRIPVVAGPPGIVVRIRNLEELLVDGSRGTIVVSPDAETRRTFQARLEAFDRAVVRRRGACHEPAFTLDRELVTVEANLGTADDVELAIDNGADGVGLFRIEQLYLAQLSGSRRDRPAPQRACTAQGRSRCAASWQGARRRCRDFSGSASVRSARPSTGVSATSLRNAPLAGPARSTHDKAFRINLDAARYGTFAEIGAGHGLRALRSRATISGRCLSDRPRR